MFGVPLVGVPLVGVPLVGVPLVGGYPVGGSLAMKGEKRSKTWEISYLNVCSLNAHLPPYVGSPCRGSLQGDSPGGGSPGGGVPLVRGFPW